MSSEGDGWGLYGVAKEWGIGIEGLKEGMNSEGKNKCMGEGQHIWYNGDV